MYKGYGKTNNTFRRMKKEQELLFQQYMSLFDLIIYNLVKKKS